MSMLLGPFLKKGLILMFSLDPSYIRFSSLLHFLMLSFLAILSIFLPDDVIYVTTAVNISCSVRPYSNGGTSILNTLKSSNS